MMNKIKRLAAGSKVLFLSLMLVAATSAGALAQSDKPWTMVGSDGTVDEDGQVIFTDNIAYLESDQATVRYNVVAVDGLVDEGPQTFFPRMTVRFRDNGNNGRVIARLKRVPINGGNTTTELTLDSNDYAGSSSFQTHSVSACGDDGFSFDFVTYAYFVEVKMTRTGLPVTPGLASIKLDMGGACFTLPQ